MATTTTSAIRAPNWRIVVLFWTISFILFYSLFQMGLRNSPLSSSSSSDPFVTYAERSTRLYDKMERDLQEKGPVFLKHGETSQSLSLSDLFTLKDGKVSPALKVANPPVRANVLRLSTEYSVPVSKAVKDVFSPYFENTIWFQDSKLYHFSMFHASHHIDSVPATEDEIGSATLGEIGIIAGGRDSKSGNLLTAAETYNSETGEWTVIPSMHKARKMCSSVIMDGKYYVIGGTGEGDNMLRCAEVYDLKLKKWTLIPDMLPERGEAKGGRPESPPLLAVVKNELYAAYYAQREVRKYDKSLNIWTTVGNLPPRTETHKGWGMAFRACGDHLVVVGGPRSRVSGILEINACVPRDGEMLQWRLVVAKPGRSYVYNCAIMGC